MDQVELKKRTKPFGLRLMKMVAGCQMTQSAEQSPIKDPSSIFTR